MRTERIPSVVDYFGRGSYQKSQGKIIFRLINPPIERFGGIGSYTINKATESHNQRFDRYRCACEGRRVEIGQRER